VILRGAWALGGLGVEEEEEGAEGPGGGSDVVGSNEAAMDGRVESVGEAVVEGDLEKSGGDPDQREGREAGEEEG